MNQSQLEQIYGATMARARGDHPEPEAIQALARREGDEATRLATLDHVMGCATCRAELDLLRSIELAGAEAGARTGSGGRSAGRSWFVPAALAASVLLAVGVGRLALGPGDEDTTRAGGDAGAVTLLTPGTTAPAGGPLTFAWRPVAGATRYRLELMTGAGDVTIEAETRDTAITLESASRLSPGDYRWWVVALTPAPGPRSALRPLRLTTP